jgi:hypothetical protein
MRARFHPEARLDFKNAAARYAAVRRIWVRAFIITSMLSSRRLKLIPRSSGFIVHRMRDVISDVRFHTLSFTWSTPTKSGSSR